MLALLFLGELIALYLLSRRLNQSIFSLFYFLTHSQRIAIALTTFLLFPGTVTHELSHLFSAEILGVHTGKLSLIPERVDADHIQAGSVEVSKTDPFRRTIIGLSPIFVGIIVITLLSIQLTNLFPTVTQQLPTLFSTSSSLTSKLPTLLFLLYGYLLFAVSNNMFSSKEDLQGVPPVLILLGIIIGALYATGFRFQLTGQILTFFESILQTLNYNIGVVLGINIALLLVLSLLLWMVRPKWRR